MQRIKEAAEKAKIELSGVTKTNINLPFITVGPNGPLHIDMDITRARFEDMTSRLVKATIGPMEQAMKDAKLAYKDIDKVVLVGGSTPHTRHLRACKEHNGQRALQRASIPTSA